MPLPGCGPLERGISVCRCRDAEIPASRGNGPSSAGTQESATNRSAAGPYPGYRPCALATFTACRYEAKLTVGGTEWSECQM